MAAAEEPEHDRLARNLANRLDQARAAVAAAREDEMRSRRRWRRWVDHGALRRRPTVILATRSHRLGLAEQDLARAAHDATRLASELRRVGPPTAGAAAARLVEAEQGQARREAWLAEHPTEAAWLSDLGNRVTKRRDELGRNAEESLPQHVVRLIGRPRAGTDDREDWRATSSCDRGIPGAMEGRARQPRP